jgi:hypothetical protein
MAGTRKVRAFRWVDISLANAYSYYEFPLEKSSCVFYTESHHLEQAAVSPFELSVGLVRPSH